MKLASNLVYFYLAADENCMIVKMNFAVHRGGGD